MKNLKIFALLLSVACFVVINVHPIHAEEEGGEDETKASPCVSLLATVIPVVGSLPVVGPILGGLLLNLGPALCVLLEPILDLSSSLGL